MYPRPCKEAWAKQAPGAMRSRSGDHRMRFSCSTRRAYWEFDDPQALGRVHRDQLHPSKNAARKSKKSCEFVCPSELKSAFPPKNDVRKSKKSCESTAPESFQSAGHDAGWNSWAPMSASGGVP